MRMYARKYNDLEVGEKRSELVEQEHVELEWLTDQLNVIFDKFEPYLGFQDHK